MQLSRRIGFSAAIVAVGGALAPVGPVHALDLGVDEQSAGYIFHYFADADDVHVFSSLGSYDLDLEHDLQLRVRLNHEAVVIPAVDAPRGSDAAVDAITTASRPIRDENDAYQDYTKNRDEIRMSVDKSGYGLGYYMSFESDYFAQQVTASYDRDLFDQNLNLAFGSSYGWDDIEPLPDVRSVGVPGYRNTTHVSAVATQVLTPTTVFRVGAELNLVHGLQHNPYRNVYVDGANVTERHPGSRSRRDVFVKLAQYFSNRSSLQLEYMLYGDDWGIGSHTLGARLNQYVTPNLVVRYRYRFYTQGAASFYREEYTQPGGVNGLQTGDYRMGDFAAHLFGTRVGWSLASLLPDSEVWSRVRIDLSYERYFNSNNFSANIFESGISLAF